MASKTHKIIFCVFIIILAAFLVKFALSKKVVEGHGGGGGHGGGHGFGGHGLGGYGLGGGRVIGGGRGATYYGGYGGNPIYIYDDYDYNYDNYYSPYYRRAYYPLYY